MNTRFLASIIALTMLTAFLMVACERNGVVKDLQDYVASVKTTEAKKKRQNLMAELQAPLLATYQADHLRSPFSFIQGGSSNPSISANPLLGYPLNVLRFVGTLSQGETTFAFIMTPDNMVYQVKVGDTIGDHQGKVTDIAPNRINVMERDAGSDGAVIQRIVTLELKEGNQ